MRSAKGEPLVEVETDKATVVYEAEVDGVLSEISVGEDETAPLGDVIARLSVAGAAPAAVPAPTASTAPPPTPRPLHLPRPLPPRRHAAARDPRRAATRSRARCRYWTDSRAPVRAAGSPRRTFARRPRAYPRPRRPPPLRADAVTETVVDLTPTQRTIVGADDEVAVRDPGVHARDREIDMEGVAALRDGLRGAGLLGPLPS